MWYSLGPLAVVCMCHRLRWDGILSWDGILRWDCRASLRVEGGRAPIPCVLLADTNERNHVRNQRWTGLPVHQTPILLSIMCL